MTRSSVSAWRATGADSTVISFGRQLVEADAVRARGVHAPARVVVAEDDRPAHLRQAAHRLGQARVEVLRAVVAVDLREDVVEQLERGDRVRGLGGRLHPVIVARRADRAVDAAPRSGSAGSAAFRSAAVAGPGKQCL